MTDQNERKALQKIEEGNKKLNKSTGFLSSLLGGGGSGVSEAIDCFINAGNSFKVAKNWNSAGEIFLRVADLHEKHSDSKFDAAQNYSEAGTCYRKVDTHKAIDCHNKAAEVYIDMGKFIMAAKVHGTMGEIYEDDITRGELDKNKKEQYKEKCMNEYQKAADYYKGEEQKSSASKCLVKVGLYAAELGQYQHAMHTFEEIAIYEVENSMLKYASKTHFFQALLCALCYDLLAAKSALKRYEEIAPIFAGSDESKFIRKLIHCVESGDPDGFAQEVKERDDRLRFDTWHTNILLKIKRTCGDGGEVMNDGETEEDEDLR